MSEFVLHVGMTKSGTTTLQDLFALHTQIHTLGKTKHVNVPGGFLNEDVRTFLTPLLFSGPRDDINLPELQRQYREVILPEAEPGQVVVASWEGLANRPPAKFTARVERIRSVVGPCKILFTLRDPVKWAASWYLQTLKNNFIRRTGDRKFQGKPYLDFETWFHVRIAERKTVDRLFCCPENIRRTVALLGASSVGVFPLEELAADTESYFTRLAEFVGIDSVETIRLAGGSHHNPRLLEAELEYIRQVGSDPARTGAWAEQSADERRAALKEHLAANGQSSEPAHIEVPESLREQIIDANRSGNRWIESELGIDMKSYGYQL